MNPDLKNKIVAAGLVACVPLVIGFEGLRTKVFNDPVGIPTACFGRTQNVKAGQTFSVDACENMLAEDLLKANDAVNGCIKAALPDTRRTALVSFAYNVGGGALCSSTLVKKLNAGDVAGGCDELSRWTKAKGVTLPGLVKRRAAERALCLQAG